MPANKDLANQVKNLKVKTREELSQNSQAEVIEITLPTSAVTTTPTTPPVTMFAPATAQVTTAPLPMHTTNMEDLIDRLISTHMTGTTTSQGIPDVIYQVSCRKEAHKVIPT